MPAGGCTGASSGTPRAETPTRVIHEGESEPRAEPTARLGDAPWAGSAARRGGACGDALGETGLKPRGAESDAVAWCAAAAGDACAGAGAGAGEVSHGANSTRASVLNAAACSSATWRRSEVRKSEMASSFVVVHHTHASSNTESFHPSGERRSGAALARCASASASPIQSSSAHSRASASSYAGMSVFVNSGWMRKYAARESDGTDEVAPSPWS